MEIEPTDSNIEKVDCTDNDKGDIEQETHNIQRIEQPDENREEIELTNDESEGIEQITRELPSFPGLLQAEEYLSVREAAQVMGVSARSVYGYIETGKLLGIRIGASIAVQADAVRCYERQVVGRPRTRTPVWRVPTMMNLQYLTNITVRVREGQGEGLEKRMEELRASGQHRITGTVARYIVRNQATDEVQIVLVWRRMVMPPDEEREVAIAALRSELADLLDWETAVYSEGRVLLSA